MSHKIVMSDQCEIGDNDHGYRFGVGKLGNRWVGFAIGAGSDGEQMMFLLPGISEDYQLGIEDRETAIKMAGAIAQSPEHGYGGIRRWFVGDDLRGKPEDFRCANCDEIGCSGACEYNDY